MPLVMECSGFIGEDGVGDSGSRRNTVSNHPNSTPVSTYGIPATDSRQHLITLRHHLHSVLRSNPSRENGLFGGQSKLGMLTTGSGI
jgi:hypothetical protein